MEVKYLEKGSDHTVDILVTKEGRSGRPHANIFAPSSVSLDKLTVAIQKGVTRNTDLRSKLGLKACPGCASSGFHIDLWDKFEEVMRVDLH
jgi:hypothetical protein